MNTNLTSEVLKYLKATASIRAREALFIPYNYAELPEDEKKNYVKELADLEKKFFSVIQLEYNLRGLSVRHRLCISIIDSLDARTILLRDMVGGEPLDQKLERYKKKIGSILDESGNETNIDFDVQKVHASKYCSYYWLSVKQSEVK